MKNVLFAALLSLASYGAMAQNYYLTTSKDGIEEVYIMSITTNRTTNTLVVFDRIKPAEGRLQDFRHLLATTVDKERVSKEEVEKIAYYRRKVQYNCATKIYRIMEISYYDLNGKVLEKVENNEKDTEWHRIAPASLIDLEFKKACNK